MRIAIGLLLLLTIPCSTFAFSAGAHRIIAEIAWQQLDFDAQTEAYSVLMQHPRYEEDFLAQMRDNVCSGVANLKGRWLFQQTASVRSTAAFDGRLSVYQPVNSMSSAAPHKSRTQTSHIERTGTPARRFTHSIGAESTSLKLARKSREQA